MFCDRDLCGDLRKVGAGGEVGDAAGHNGEELREPWHKSGQLIAGEGIMRELAFCISSCSCVMRSMLDSSCSIAGGPRRAIQFLSDHFDACHMRDVTHSRDTTTTTTTTTTLHLETWEMMVEVSQIVGTSFETNQRQNRPTRQTRLARGGFSVLCPRYVLLIP